MRRIKVIKKSRILRIITAIVCFLVMLVTGCFDYLGGIKDEMNAGLDYSVYVNSTTGNDSPDNGLPDRPFKTIQYAIDQAYAAFPAPRAVRICVAAGTYTISSAITMRDGISIYGGYNAANWKDRNNMDRSNPVYKTEITGSPAAISCVSITSATVIDGFTIQGGVGANSHGIQNIDSYTIINNNSIHGGSGTTSYGIYNSISSPTISNNTINGGSGSNTYGIYNSSSSSNINNNKINGGTAGFTASGIRNDNSPVIISNNTIFSGTSTNLTTTYAIYNNNSSSAINNNTINGGSSNGSSIGIYIIDASPNIKNNIIFTTATGGERYGIREANASSNPQSVQNNNIFSCTTALYRDDNSNNITNLTTAISTGEGSQTLAYWGNISDGSTAMFMDFSGGNLRLRSDAPLNVRGGGLDLSASFKTDMDGVLRTTSSPTGMTNTGAAGWSMGAYERD